VFLDEKERLIGATLIGETNESGLCYYLVKNKSKNPRREVEPHLELCQNAPGSGLQVGKF
jgi:hypothetical protein